MDMRLTGARLETLVGRGQANPPVEGALVGRAQLSGAGDSIRSAAPTPMARSPSPSPTGEISPGSAELLGINATRDSSCCWAKDQTETPMRCAVAEFHGQGGVLSVRRMVLDTGVVLAQGHGTVDLRNETVDLRLEGSPRSSVLVRSWRDHAEGSLRIAQIGVDVGKATGQLAIAGILGAVSRLWRRSSRSSPRWNPRRRLRLAPGRSLGARRAGGSALGRRLISGVRRERNPSPSHALRA